MSCALRSSSSSRTSRVGTLISPLRQRMIEDMTARHFAEKVQRDYIRHVKNFAAFLGRSPDTATSEDLRLYQSHMTKSHVSPPSINAATLAGRRQGDGGQRFMADACDVRSQAVPRHQPAIRSRSARAGWLPRATAVATKVRNACFS